MKRLLIHCLIDPDTGILPESGSIRPVLIIASALYVFADNRRANDEMELLMALKLIKPRPFRLLLVTFDLTSTVPGDRRYREADAALSFHGPVFRPVKQLRLVISRSTSQRIKSSIEQRIGRRTTIFIAPITSIPAWRIYGVQKKREWKRFVQALIEHNVEVKYATEAAENEL